MRHLSFFLPMYNTGGFTEDAKLRVRFDGAGADTDPV